MRTVLVIAASAFAAACFAGSAQAADIVGVGRCDVTINDRVVSKGRHCSQLILREDTANGRSALVFTFPDGFHLQIAGPALAFGTVAYSLAPDELIWANPGQTNPQTVSGQPGAFRGRCSIRKTETGDGLAKVDCKVRSPIGRIDVEFRTPKQK